MFLPDPVESFFHASRQLLTYGVLIALYDSVMPTISFSMTDGISWNAASQASGLSYWVARVRQLALVLVSSRLASPRAIARHVATFLRDLVHTCARTLQPQDRANSVWNWQLECLSVMISPPLCQAWPPARLLVFMMGSLAALERLDDDKLHDERASSARHAVATMELALHCGVEWTGGAPKPRTTRLKVRVL